jgi:spermidine synthase
MNEPNLNVVVSDGRAFIARSEHRYSVVVLDAYRLPYIPWHLTTVEFFQEVRDHLTDDGVVVINVGRTPGDYRLVEAMVATLQQIFPSTHTMDVASSYNAIVVATVQPTSPDNLEANIPLLDNPVLQVIASEALGNLRTVEPGPMVFTDDRAPVEMLTHSIVFNYILDR